MNAMQRLGTALSRAEAVASMAAALMLLATMLVVVADVGLRYFLHRPLEWSYDLVSLYLMVGAFFFALSDTLAHDEHVCVDILHQRMPAWVRHLCEAIGYLCGVAVFGAIVWLGAARTIDAFRAGEVGSGAIPWPMWLSTVAVPIGAGLMVLRMAFRAVGHLASLVLRQSLIALPVPAGAEEAA